MWYGPEFLYIRIQTLQSPHILMTTLATSFVHASNIYKGDVMCVCVCVCVCVCSLCAATVTNRWKPNLTW